MAAGIVSPSSQAGTARNLMEAHGMKARDLMTREVVTLKVDDHLDLADDIMRLGRIRHMPVVGKDGRLVGILSQRDLFRAGISSVLHLRHQLEREWLGKVRVKDVMTKTVATVDGDAPVRTAVGLMIDKQIGCVPVVDGERLIGLLSESDCLRYLARLLDISEEKAQLPELPQ